MTPHLPQVFCETAVSDMGDDHLLINCSVVQKGLLNCSLCVASNSMDAWPKCWLKKGLDQCSPFRVGFSEKPWNKCIQILKYPKNSEYSAQCRGKCCQAIGSTLAVKSFISVTSEVNVSLLRSVFVLGSVRQKMWKSPKIYLMHPIVSIRCRGRGSASYIFRMRDKPRTVRV